MNIKLRPACNEDLEWLDPFYEKLMRPYVELTHSWDEKKFRESFSPEHTSIIQAEGHNIGMLKVEVREKYIYLGDIQIVNEFQSRGIGSALIQKVIQKAKSLYCPIRLRVLKGNPSIKLYERHGFTVIEELDNCFELEYRV